MKTQIWHDEAVKIDKKKVRKMKNNKLNKTKELDMTNIKRNREVKKQ